MGGAMIEGWRASKTLADGDLLIWDPSPGPAALAAAARGARLNGPVESLAEARTVVLAVKPQAWRPAAQAVAPHLGPDAVILSVMAGVNAADIGAAFGGRAVVRAMPTMAVAALKGAASLWSADADARSVARALFSPLGVVADLNAEDQLHAATAVSGSAPAYVFALVEALEAAALNLGLDGEAARILSRSALAGAAALMETSGLEAGALRRQVTSPGGTTAAALEVLMGDGRAGRGNLNGLIADAAEAAAARSRELGR